MLTTQRASTPPETDTAPDARRFFTSTHTHTHTYTLTHTHIKTHTHNTTNNTHKHTHTHPHTHKHTHTHTHTDTHTHTHKQTHAHTLALTYGPQMFSIGVWKGSLHNGEDPTVDGAEAAERWRKAHYLTSHHSSSFHEVAII